MIIEASGLGRSFGDVHAVRDVDLQVAAGEVLGLIGPNGGGKSTLLLLLAGLIRPTAGTVKVEGVAAHDLAMQHTGRVGLITAEPGLYPLLTARDNLAFFGGLYGRSAADVNALATPILEELGVTDLLDKRTAGFSSGQRQKISLCRALLLEPVVLMLDEPTANLDPVSTHTIHQQVRKQADNGVAVVLCTHDLHAAETICDRVVVMKQTIVGGKALQGERRPPPPGELYTLYTEHA